MKFKSSRKGEYHCFKLSGAFDTQAILNIKGPLYEIIEKTGLGLTLDFEEISSLDANGTHFLENVLKTLEAEKRPMVIYGCGNTLSQVEALGRGTSLKVYKDEYAFENAFSENLQNIKKRYFDIAIGTGAIRRLSLQCPLCGKSGLIGYMCDEQEHELHWEENEITPQWRLVKDLKNELDFDLYEVAVCHKCFFASARMEHFVVVLPEGILESVLTDQEKDRLHKGLPARAGFLNEYYKTNAKSFLSLPRKRLAGYYAWQLYDKTVREMARDKPSIRYIEVCRANILSAKFSVTDVQRINSLTTAHVWLSSMVENSRNQSTLDLVQAYVYLISVSLALEKAKLAKTLGEIFLEKFGSNLKFRDWTDRARAILQEDD